MAEKYIIQRTQSFTRTHAKPMKEWLDAGRGDEAAYYAEFRKTVDRSERKWRADVAQIESDTQATFREKRVQLSNLNRVEVSWTPEQETAFINVYGDPRDLDRGRLEAQITELQDTHWNALREGQMQLVPKTPWQRRFHAALMAPEDGSVPLGGGQVVLPYPSNRQPDDAASVPVAAAPAFVVVPSRVSGYITDADQEVFASHMQGVARRTCPRCHEHFRLGLKRVHVGSARCLATQAKATTAAEKAKAAKQAAQEKAT